MKALACLLVLAMICSVSPAHAALELSAALDAAFIMMEEGNPFALRYCELTGASIKAMLPLGMPYFFGGRNWENALKVRVPIESSNFFKVGSRYLFGLDCVGFTRWVNEYCSQEEHPSLAEMVSERKSGKHHVDLKKSEYADWYKYLKFGDFLVTYYPGGRHIMMYIGTLADYGYTAQTLPELADYLTYPLVAHCGNNPFHGAWYQAYIDENNLNANTTDGGVCVSVIGVPPEKATVTEKVQKTEYAYFWVDGYMLTVKGLDSVYEYAWYRM